MTVNQLAHREYLKSATWQDIRIRILERDNNLCQKCKNPGNQIHHLTYDRWGCELDEDLQTLCSSCHSTEHKIKKIFKGKAIGSIALYKYLTNNQKELIKNKLGFKFKEDLYLCISTIQNFEVVKFAADLLGYKYFYNQSPNEIVQKKSGTKDGRYSSMSRRSKTNVIIHY